MDARKVSLLRELIENFLIDEIGTCAVGVKRTTIDKNGDLLVDVGDGVLRVKVEIHSIADDM